MWVLCWLLLFTPPSLQPVETLACQSPSEAFHRALLKSVLAKSGARNLETRFSSPLARNNSTPFEHAWILMNFVDHDASAPGQLRDFQNGERTYDLSNGYNHSGTDFALWPFAWYAMDAEDVAVVAAAPGILVGKIDGQPDTNCTFEDGSTWNAIYVQHEDGSVAIYGHLKRGSLVDKVFGEPIARGEVLGLVGSSGQSTAPHLHFEVLDAAGNVVDPFFGPGNPTVEESLWLEQPSYINERVMGLTTHAAEPFFGCYENDAPRFQKAFQPGDDVYFVGTFSDLRDGGEAILDVMAPDGEVIWTAPIAEINANVFGPRYLPWFITTAESWPAGIYAAELRLGDEAVRTQFSVGRLDAPEFVSVALEPQVVALGSPVTLSWQTRNAHQVTIKNGVGVANGSGSITFVPAESGTIGLLAEGVGGVASAVVTAEVRPNRTYWVPHLTAAGGGFTSDLNIKNVDCCVIDITVGLFTTGGEVLPPLTLALQPGEGFVLDEENRPENAAYAQIESHHALNIGVSYRPGEGGSPALWQATEAVGTVFETQRGDALTVWDGIAVVNASNLPAEVWITQTDANGNRVRWQPDGFEAVGPGVKVLAVLNHGLPDETQADVTIESSQPIVVTALRGSLAGCEPYVMWGVPIWLNF